MPMETDTYVDTSLIPTLHYAPGMDYSDSDIYVGGNSSISETLGPPRYPMPNTAKRSLEDRVRDYTGFRQDERLEHPAGSSSGRSSDSRSPFLETQNRNKRRIQGSTSPQEVMDWNGMVMAERNYETPNCPNISLRGDTIWETKLDQDVIQASLEDQKNFRSLTKAKRKGKELPNSNCLFLSQEYLKYGTMQNSQRPDLVLANTHSTKTLAHHKQREKSLFGRPCLFNCSWRLVAIALTILALLLSSVIVYFGAVKYPQQLPPLPNSVIDSNGLR